MIGLSGREIVLGAKVEMLIGDGLLECMHFGIKNKSNTTYTIELGSESAY